MERMCSERPHSSTSDRLGTDRVRRRPTGPGHGQDGHGCGLGPGRGGRRSTSSAGHRPPGRPGSASSTPGSASGRRRCSARSRRRPGGIRRIRAHPAECTAADGTVLPGSRSRSRHRRAASRRPASGPSAARASAVIVVRVTGRGSSSIPQDAGHRGRSAGSTRGRRTITDRPSVRTGRGVPRGGGGQDRRRPARPAPPGSAAPEASATTMPGTAGVASRPSLERVDVGEHGDRVVERMDRAPGHMAPLDGHLGDAEAESVGQDQDLDVEGEPLDPDQVEQEAGHRGAEGLEAALGVAEPEPGAGGDQTVEEPAHDRAHGIGALHHRVGQRPRSDGQVVGPQPVDQHRDGPRVDGHVGVHVGGVPAPGQRHPGANGCRPCPGWPEG